jgi:transposase
MMIRYYDQQHGFYAGVDLHTRRLHLCVLDARGQVVKDVNVPANPEAFLQAIAPYRSDLVVGCECMFAWYWLADRCEQEKVRLVVGHAYYMRLIHGAKAKSDKIDANKIARLLKGGNFPLSYTYPKGMRETRDLLRRRTGLVRHRVGCSPTYRSSTPSTTCRPCPRSCPPPRTGRRWTSRRASATRACRRAPLATWPSLTAWIGRSPTSSYT